MRKIRDAQSEWFERALARLPARTPSRRGSNSGHRWLDSWLVSSNDTLAAAIRGLVVGAGVLAVTVWFVELRLGAPLWAFAFALLGAALLGALGLIAGIVSEKIDQLAAFQNFVIMPLSFLSGVFYSIHSLPGFWQKLSHANPFFYMVDGFRYGFLGISDVPPYASLAVLGVSFLIASLISLGLLKAGYKLRY